jgi:hypothetical protein
MNVVNPNCILVYDHIGINTDVVGLSVKEYFSLVNDRVFTKSSNSPMIVSSQRGGVFNVVIIGSE